MLKACLMNVNPPLWKNRFFSHSVNKDSNGVNDSFIALRTAFKRIDVSLATQDINPPDKADIVIWIDDLRNDVSKSGEQLHYLIVQEPEPVNKRNWDQSRWNKYDRIFCWNNDLKQPKNVTHLPFAYAWKPYSKSDWGHRTKDIVLIANCKHLYHPKSLTEKRIHLIKWLAKNHPEKVDVFGRRWENHVFHGKFTQYLSHLPALFRKKLSANHWSNTIVKGPVSSKVDTLNKYLFAICFENSEYSGFLTEKIFHCFSAGVVPIYWGASNVEKLLPKYSFIDARAFNSFTDLYNQLLSFSEENYATYLESIKKFYVSGAAKKFTPKSYADTVVTSVIQDI